MDRINQWFESALGREMNPDGAYGLQCKDVTDDYSAYLFGSWETTLRPGDAVDTFDNANSDYFDKTENDPNDSNQLPIYGDIIVWNGWDTNSFGHIAVVDSADVDGVTVYEQNGGTGLPCSRATHAWGLMPVRGWLRPIQDKIIGVVDNLTPNQRITATEVNERKSASTWSELFGIIEPEIICDFKGYVHGEAIEGNGIWFVGAYSGHFFHSSGFTNQSITGLQDLTPEAIYVPVETAPVAPVPVVVASDPIPVAEPVPPTPVAVVVTPDPVPVAEPNPTVTKLAYKRLIYLIASAAISAVIAWVSKEPALQTLAPMIYFILKTISDYLNKSIPNN